MPITRPTVNELAERIRADLYGELYTSGAAPIRGFIWALSVALAGAVWLLYGYAEFVYRQMFPDSADNDGLLRWGSIYGVPYRSATRATGLVRVTGSGAVAIPAGTLLSRPDNALFETTTDAALALVSGSYLADIEVEAQAAGADGNSLTATALTFATPVGGVDTTAVVQAPGLTGGSDDEPLPLYRERVIARIQAPPHGGSAADYKAWALEVPQVTRVWVMPQLLGPGNVTLAFVCDALDPIIPTLEKADEFRAYINERRPVTDGFVVFIPQAQAVPITIQLLVTDTPEVRAAIEAQLRDIFLRDSEYQGLMYPSRISEAISTAAGEFAHVLVSPTAPVQALPNHIHVLGAVTYV
jgi:uncharacterized phage protein gp47/JayE